MKRLQTINKERVRTRFSRSLPFYDGDAVVQGKTARMLVTEICREGRKHFENVLEVGCGTGLLSREIAGSLRVEQFVANDVVEGCRPFVEEVFTDLPHVNLSFMGGDIENFAFHPESLDLVASNAVFHWLEDIEELLARFASALRQDGLLAFSTFGPENFDEIKALTGGGLQYHSFGETAEMLAGRFHPLCQREIKTTLRFSSPRAVLEHLRRTGVNGLTREGWTKRSLRSFEEKYRSLSGEGDSLPLTYHTMLFVARRRE